MKLPYVVALARQILAARQMILEKIKTGLLPKVCESGTLQCRLSAAVLNRVARQEDEDAHQKKLLKPRTRMHTPVNCTTDAKSLSNASMRLGNMGARARGPKPWIKETAVARAMVLNFQYRFQFCFSHISGRTP